MISILVMLGAFSSTPQEAPRQPRPKPAAMILDLKGKVEIRPASGTPAVAKLGDLIYPGERLAVPADGAATLAILSAGAQEVIRPGSEAIVGLRGCDPPEAIGRRIERRKALASTMKGLTPAPDDARKAAAVFRSKGESAPAVVPISGSTVASDRPALAWPAAEGVKSYRVRLIVQGSERVVWNVETKEPRADFPADKPALQRGNLYRWEVTDAGFRPVVAGEFSVATDSDLQELAEAKAAAQGDNRADRLAAALAYRGLGAYAESIEVLERLSADSPGEPLYRAMLTDLRGLAGRPAAAAK